MELTREQVIKALKCCSNQVCQGENCPIYRINNGNCTQGDVDALMFSAAELLEQDIRTPDAVTGLVNCGCGGKPYQSGPKNNSCWMYTCADCLITTEPQPNNAWAKKDWNEAMGYHPEEGAE